ncbi:conserved membrane hypothetical protein [Bradyrhizobium sp. ORS 375]|uniref:hypothetical protein n=1 Tax=Bradyrhizobium sp. (strain ORS 375) TaxID=566679 RepID=UPI0002407401|nr:hypothetical protein [Bradyrhizobium sp. ORS 375]CCD90797.1 conserved membrane hypothetical protein [Bradyrhizobium sp. ORS 375]
MTTGIRSSARQSIPGASAGIGLLIAAAAALTVAVVGFTGALPSVSRGWLVGFAIWSSVPIGSMTLLMIHRLTGGTWGVAARPVLRPAAALMPMVLIAIVPILASLPSIYPWAADPGRVPADVARWYLSSPWFVLRALVTLAGWSVLGLVFAMRAGSRLLAALGLAFFGLTISLVSVDWYLSVEPDYVATAFAAMIAIQQMLAALAVATVLTIRVLDPKVAGDLGGLLIATLLGVVYLGYMTMVVAWYGDLPDKAEWFLKRVSPVWLAVLLVAFVAGALLPFGMLMIKSVRSSSNGLLIAGGLILIGVSLHLAWLITPAFPQQAATVAFAAITLLVLALASAVAAPGVRSPVEGGDAD